MEKIQFNYDLWVNNKDKYDLVTRDGRSAKVYTCDPSNLITHQVIGSVDNCVTCWGINGKLNNNQHEYGLDLMMVEKKQTKTHGAIIVAVRYPKSGMLYIEACSPEDREAIESNLIQEGFDYQIKEIEFEF